MAFGENRPYDCRVRTAGWGAKAVISRRSDFGARADISFEKRYSRITGLRFAITRLDRDTH